MYIKRIVLDGFKSYGQRTEINGFDPLFTAITGLNGTGKSNILDSICFVLGITNLSAVRAGSLQDLIFKNGTAGVTKATVSVIFDNTNKEQSPPGFENDDEITITRQVVMGGKNKYLVNGLNVQNKRVQDLFCSVHLNVNNPHFLIMQGRITKVLNMKPPEILSMLEEAVGTRMYEVKRQMSQKTIEKKDMKLNEMRKLLEEEISPKLQRLKQERQSYLEYQHIERELEHKMNLYQVWQHLSSQKEIEKLQRSLDTTQKTIEDYDNNIKTNENNIKLIDEETKKMIRQAEADDAGVIKTIEAELREKEKEEAHLSAVGKTISSEITSEENKKKQLQKHIKSDVNAVKVKEEEWNKVQNHFETLKTNENADKEAYAAAQKKFEALSLGMEINDEGEAETLQEQLIRVRQELSEASTQFKQATMELSHNEKQLIVKEKEFSGNFANYEKDRKAMEKLESEVNNLEGSLKKIKYSEETMNELQAKRQALVREIKEIRSRIEIFESQRPYTNFRHKNAESNSRQNSIKGVVCRLIDVKNKNNCVALETVAGGRLYNVIVDTELTSKQLLQDGSLKRRTTFIPLNKIQSGKLNPNVVQYAQDLVGKENVQPALELLTYNKSLQSAMQYVFGSTFVCKDLNTAKQVAFNKRIMKRCVTLEGDVIDPAGILSGGAMDKGGSVLLQVQEIMRFEEELRKKEAELKEVEAALNNMSEYQEQWLNVKRQLDLRQHEYNVTKRCLQQSIHHQQKEEIDNLKKSIVELKEKIKQSKEKETNDTKRVRELENKMKNSSGYKEKQLKLIEAEMKKLKEKSDNSSKEWQKCERNYEVLKLEISELKKAIETKESDLGAIDETIQKLKEKLEDQNKIIEESKERVKEKRQQLENETKIIAEKNKEIHKKNNDKEKQAAQIAEFKLEIKKLNLEIGKIKENLKTMKAKEKEYSKKSEKHERYVEEAQKLDAKSSRELENRLREMQEARNKLGRTINVKAQTMYEQEEKMFNDLLKKFKIVENDRRNLLEVMADLDRKKIECLSTAWKQVSKDFGSIFSTLLVGANSKLVPADGENILKGLEIKVSLGGVWKESLSELSGGQRSLIALSLILAMLLFKPAPLYILDEVDAALDMSHTQNIGNMLKSHFKQSQFIIVSLKDGMFNNANVLYRTKFVDGVSAVTRTVNNKH